LKSIDADKNGKIDFQEFVTAAQSRDKMLNEKNLKKVFKIFDANNDGSITQEEMSQVWAGCGFDKKNTQIWEKIISEVDKNENGKVEYEEFRDAMLLLMKERASFAAQK
jgi:calcium-dependent protein kinase